MSNHTPGPWRSDDENPLLILDANGASVAMLNRLYHSTECEINRRLIAAAPETAAERDRLREVNAALLAILKRILAAHQTGNSGAVNGEAILCRHFEAAAQDAIAKAEGKS